KRRLVTHLAALLGEGAPRMVVAVVDCAALCNPDSAAVFTTCLAAVQQAAGGFLPPGDATHANARLAFEAAVRQGGRSGCQVVLALVALEHLAASSQIDVSLFNALRSAATRLPLALLTTSQHPLIELTYAADADSIRSSPFFNIFAQITLPGAG
ncbi:MAG TPA: hypothetical protein VFT99_17785, partial [Roseiflexaceae bacterium]|nr:hypothetical protein [Roseiflexaceae bacterium]